MTDENTQTQAAERESPAFSLRYFVSLNEQDYINAMLIAFDEADASNYVAQNLAELSQTEFESVGPDCQLISGQVVKGHAIEPVLDAEAKQAILSARIRDASEKIQTLADAIELNMAEEGDNERLTAWKKYRVLLSQLDASTSLKEWPTPPSETA